MLWRIGDWGLGLGIGRIADCGLRMGIADWGLGIADCGLRIADCGWGLELRIANWKEEEDRTSRELVLLNAFALCGSTE
jgi:hypothetical protein